MKNLKLLLIVFSIIFMGINATAQDVQLIGVHMGNVDNMAVLDLEEFPDFEFYYNDAPLIEYSEEQKMVGYNTKLKGQYGEVPEKMGFSASWVGSEGKYRGNRSYKGAIMVVDPDGTIGYQSSPDYSEGMMNDIRSIVKKFKKGKMAKKLKASKQEYLKKAPVGEVELYKGSKVDKDGIGITGWDLPDLSIKNDKGETLSFQEITNGKISIIVFFTLNGIHYLEGDKKGVIESESDGRILMSSRAYSEKINDKVMNADVTDKKSAKKAFAKTMFKTAVANSDAGLLQKLVNSKGELDDVGKANSYVHYTEYLRDVQANAEYYKK